MCLSQGTQMRRLDGSQTHTTLTPGQYAAVIYSSDLKDTSGDINLNSWAFREILFSANSLVGFSEVFLKREKDYATEKHWDLWHKENSYTDLTRREETEAKTWKTKGAPPVKARECLTGDSKEEGHWQFPEHQCGTLQLCSLTQGSQGKTKSHQTRSSRAPETVPTRSRNLHPPAE